MRLETHDPIDMFEKIDILEMMGGGNPQERCQVMESVILHSHNELLDREVYDSDTKNYHFCLC